MKIYSHIIYPLIAKLLPLKKEVVFSSFNGHYSDSPKYISIQLHNSFPNIPIVWLVDERFIKELPDYIKGIDIKSESATIHKLRASVLVDNVYGKKGIALIKSQRKKWLSKLLVKLNRNRRQLNISTWHGTPLKKMGIDQVNSDYIDFLSPELIMFHPNIHTMNIMDRITFHKINSIVVGAPRNDCFFQHFSSNELQNIKEELGIPPLKKIILYAPTFRSDGLGEKETNINRSGLEQIELINFDLLLHSLETKFDGEWVFIGRFHYLVDNKIDWEELNKKYTGKIINGNIKDDMCKYLLCADVLLTDYSSSMFDYSLTGRPCFLFCPDILHYMNAERGFYFKIEELPFPVASSFDELIRDIYEFDEQGYSKKLKEFNERIGVADKGDATNCIVEYIKNHSTLDMK